MDDRPPALRAAAKRRLELKDAASRVEVAAASPAALDGWRDHLVHELHELRSSLANHIEEVEGPDGLLVELASAQPRLTNQIAHVKAEHPALCQQLEATIQSTAASSSAVDQIRQEVRSLLSAITAHRQHGADLVYEGYCVDIGGG